MSGILIKEDLFSKYSILDHQSSEGQKIHAFLESRARALLGHVVDFDKNPITFVMSDSDEPNAFFAPVSPREERYTSDSNVRRLINPLENSVVCFTKGLIDMVDNLDQLDYVLGHELTHMLMRGFGIDKNSKGEEEIADLHAVDLVFDAGGDPKQALKMEEKLHGFVKLQREKARAKASHYISDDKEEGIDWSAIFDVHMTHSNRKSAIEASLTRLSHLIDDREPTGFDKSAFTASYSDPVDAYLKERDYANQSPLDKLRILVDSVDYLSGYISPESYFQSVMDGLSEKYDDTLGYNDSPSDLETQQQKIQALIDAGYERYFTGKTVDNLPQINRDLDDVSARILQAKTVEEFTTASEELDVLDGLYREIKTPFFGYNKLRKLDNLSFVGRSYSAFAVEPDKMGQRLEGGLDVPWNNLVELAKTDEDAKAQIVQFLEKQEIEDFRITHNLPYIRIDGHKCYTVNDEGQASKEKINEYELDYAVHNERVMQSYAFIKDYFDNEETYVDEVCTAYLSLSDDDFRTFIRVSTTDRFNRYSSGQMRQLVAEKIKEDFVTLYNSLPALEGSSSSTGRDVVFSVMAKKFLSENSPPWMDENGDLLLDRNLFEFDNPIFQQYFGEDLRKRLSQDKETQQQKMFETAMRVIKIVSVMFREASAEKTAIQEKIQDMWEARRNLKKGEDDSVLQAKSDSLHDALHFYETKADITEKTMWSFTTSAFGNINDEYHLNRLRPEQRMAIARLVVDDKDNIFLTEFNQNRYEAFCDLVGIMPNQIDEAIAGNYELSDDMQAVSKAIGYEVAGSKEALSQFVAEIDEDRRGKYHWFLTVFEHMSFLEKDPEIDLYSFTRAVSQMHISRSASARIYGYSEVDHERFDAYRKFMIESNLMPLLAKAVGYKKNFEGLDFDTMIATADSLISVRAQFTKFLVRTEKYWHFDEEKDCNIEREKNIVKPEDKKFLEFLDKQIRGLLRRAEHQALLQSNPLTKMSDLYRLHNHKRPDFGSKLSRMSYFSGIDKKEKTSKAISALSREASFWPDDALEHVKAFVLAKNTFLDDIALEDEILNNILQKVEALPSGEKKKECLFILLDKNLRSSYPETRSKLFKAYADDVLVALGKDDGSDKYQERLAVYLKEIEGGVKQEWDIGRQYSSDNLLSNSMSRADKYILLREVSEAVTSQEQTSLMFKEACQVNLTPKDMAQSYLQGIGIDYITEEMDRDAPTANKFIEFLNSKGEMKDCQDVSDFISDKVRDKKIDARILAYTEAVRCKILYENFWSAPIETRAVLIARMLKSAVNVKGEELDESDNAWEKVFNVVMDNLIPPDDTSIEGQYARDIMHSYIKARSDYERELILSAMMVANQGVGEDAGNVGKALKLFLENMGPAEIKLGQAIASHPNTPEAIKIELQELKNAADKPARWTLYDWIRSENIPQEYWKDKYLGDILGSASYYTTVALGDGDVLRMLRPEAREKAIKGFKVIGDTIEDLRAKDKISDLDYQELTESVTEMVTQAARMSSIETDHDIGEAQHNDAKGIYNGVKLSSGGHNFTLRVMDWQAKGQNWVIMKRAKGPIFNELPTNTPEAIAFQKELAKSYIVFEIQNILSGKKFDHDKHGAQLCGDIATGEVGIFDTGAMALNAPSLEDQKILGHVIYDVIKDIIHKEDTLENLGASLSRHISDKIVELHKNNVDTQYLVEVKKGLLALGDFFKVLNQEDMKDLLPRMNILACLSDGMKEGMSERMSFVEKAWLATISGEDMAVRDNGVTIIRETSAQANTERVIDVGLKPIEQRKATWLHSAFTSPEEGDENSAGFPNNDSSQYLCFKIAA